MKNSRVHFIKHLIVNANLVFGITHRFLFLRIMIIFLLCFLPKLTLCKNPDWSLLFADDSLSLYFKNKCAGSLLHKTIIDTNLQRIIVTSQISIITNATISFPAMTLKETRIYNFNGFQIKAKQDIKSTAGLSSWDLSKTNNGKWNLVVTVGGVKQNKIIDSIAGNLNASYAIQNAILNNTASIGQKWQDTLFDLSTATHIIVQTECVSIPDTKNKNYVFINNDNMIGRDERWEVNREGKTVMQAIPPFFTARQNPPDGFSDSMGNTLKDIGEISELFKISFNKAPGKNETIALQFSSGAFLHESVRNMYKKNNDKYLLKPQPVNCINSQSKKNSTKENEQWLLPSITIQSKHPDIVKLAKKLRISTNEKCEQIEIVNDYVYKNIKKKNVATFSNACETLKSGFGDCGEHAVLLCALLRALKIESNVVIGLVYVSQKKGYYYHAWVIAKTPIFHFADPALGIFPTPNIYIPLVIDNNGRKIVHLAKIIDRIRVSYYSNVF